MPSVARTNSVNNAANQKDGEICPVCKSSRYLNKGMEFLINPECYHKMCGSCVDRIFTGGPNTCPIAGCAKTLRKQHFRPIKFEDLKVEREVDIRKRVARVMDKQEDDFETLKDYNDYLEQVEEITWNLILKVDLDATESRLRRWEEHQRAEKNPNAIRRTFQSTAPSDNNTLRKGVTQRKAVSAVNTPQSVADNTMPDTGFSFHGLKKRVKPPPEAAFDPFGGWSIVPQYHIVQDDYDVDWLTSQKNDKAHLAGGYEMTDFYNRALREAFSGFGVFVQDEIMARNVPSGDAGIGTKHAAMAAAGGKDVNMDDVF